MGLRPPDQPLDYAEFLKEKFTIIIDPNFKEGLKLSERNRKKLALITKAVEQLRGAK